MKITDKIKIYRLLTSLGKTREYKDGCFIVTCKKTCYKSVDFALSKINDKNYVVDLNCHIHSIKEYPQFSKFDYKIFVVYKFNGYLKLYK